MKKFLIFMSLFLLTLNSALFAQKDSNSNSIPPQPSSWVSDSSGLISTSGRIQLENICQTLKKQTGAELAILLVPTIGENSIEDYANKVFESWKIGNQKENNGVLIVFAKNDREIRVEVGYGLEDVLPDGKVGALIREQAIPQFKLGSDEQGLIQLSLSMADIIASKYGVQAQQKPKQQKSSWGMLIFILILLIVLPMLGINPFWLLLFFGRGGGGRGNDSGFGGFGGGSSGGGGASGKW